MKERTRGSSENRQYKHEAVDGYTKKASDLVAERSHSPTTNHKSGTADNSLLTVKNGMQHASRDRQWRVETDSTELSVVPGFPANSSARTTFYGLRRRLWKFQHDRGHAWDDRGKETVRNHYTAIRSEAILQQCEVPKWAESVAVGRLFSTDTRGFNRHYGGTDGACIGFALIELYDSPEKAQESYVANLASSVVPKLDPAGVSGLIEYVFKKYGEGS
jgi:hypothetical protein